MNTIEALAATRAARHEGDIARKVRRYEACLLAAVGARGEGHDTPITDAEHLVAVQYVAAAEAFEASLRAPKLPPRVKPAPVVEVVRKKRRKKRAAAKKAAAPVVG